ncbi:hypothetical protein LV716_16100 [Flagellimonas sp. HMM57]|uniref:hypothetical protein n=1 Tax=unclassified Flagellimonas TaxID=2644544 RepID=UPI0013D1486A|nr:MULTISPECIES: hypothetical protein [unclassified Flagellimonas]UII75764.1 hypothetical protein LV716_16100 [Flagellimonas sp. HMM57]
MKRLYLFLILTTPLLLTNSCSSDTEEEIPLNDKNTIESFSVLLGTVAYKAQINQQNSTISLALPFGTDLTQISPDITTAENSSILPVSGTVQNFQSPRTYVVTAENGDVKEYIITIIAPNDERKILTFFLETDDAEIITGFIDEESNSILLEVPNSLDLSALKMNFTVSENAVSEPLTGSIVDLSNPFICNITAENGTPAKYKVAAYTTNQLFNPDGENNGDGWNFVGDTGIESTSDFGNIFFITADEGDFSPNINQTITFPRDYSRKYVLFIGNLTTEKAVAGSITRHPYLWAYQTGEFSQDDWIYMQGMTHREDENVWEVVSGTHQLLPNVTGTHFRIAQARQKGDPFDGTRSKYRDLEVRLFESPEDASIYVNKLYQK